MLAPDWAQKNALYYCAQSFRELVHDGYCLATIARFVHQACACKVQGKLLFSTFLTRNEGTTDESKKRLGCYQQEQLNLARIFCF